METFQTHLDTFLLQVTLPWQVLGVGDFQMDLPTLTFTPFLTMSCTPDGSDTGP